ncbi:MAG: molybdopterin molybdotransferase MoeA [Clostridia bacterium]|nr:molybdopterin molybdotransferase MoeA [Clostridia bacterium]
MDIRIHPDAAAEALLSLARPPEAEEVALGAALRRVAAEELRAVLPNPPFRRSAYDGYALFSADTRDASEASPAVFRVSGELPAGCAPAGRLARGDAVRSLTGAPVPEGADAVVPKERTMPDGEGRVRVFAALRPGENVAPVGEDVRPGELLISGGERLGPAALGLAAGQGLDTLRVFRRPRLALISTGSELLRPGEAPEDGKIYHTNLFTLGAYLELLGAAAADGGLVGDDAAAVAAAIERALPGHDAVLLTGGASVGEYDFTLAAMRRLGGRILFHRTAMKPGGAMLAAEIGGKAVIGLSGNPGAAALGLLRVAAPFVKALAGRRELFWPRAELLLKKPLLKPSPQMRLLRGRLEIEGGRAFFSENGRQQNGAVSSLSGCDLIGEISAGSPPLPAGAAISAFRIMEGV